jgi:adenine-specific DNA-methyltransferase
MDSLEMRYIGSKTHLISEIQDLVPPPKTGTDVFCDLFAGTGVVGNSFKHSCRLICNDILYFAFVINYALNKLTATPRFTRAHSVLKCDPLNYLNRLQMLPTEPTDIDFVCREYSPSGPRGRKYLSVSNALFVDRVRRTLNDWKSDGIINLDEFHYLLAGLILEIPSVSNIAGSYGAFLKHWDKRTLKPLQVRRLDIVSTSFSNDIFNEDANSLISKISGDVLYLDTPYNGRQYSSNYHLLETVARYDQPTLTGISGTRSDSQGSSDYCRAAKVFAVYDELLCRADFGTVIVSYSSDGLLSKEELVNLLCKHGVEESLVFREIPYRRYRRIANDDRPLTEYLFRVSR